MEVSINGGTPSHHPFIDGIFPHKKHPAMGVAIATSPGAWDPVLTVPVPAGSDHLAGSSPWVNIDMETYGTSIRADRG